jgi:uncharacterized protein with HEPN domain
MRQDAVIRKLQVIGEAVKLLPDSVTTQRPEIPWRRIAGMRDKIIHEYFGVDLELVWAVVEREFAPLKSAVEESLREVGHDSQELE